MEVGIHFCCADITIVHLSNALPTAHLHELEPCIYLQNALKFYICFIKLIFACHLEY